MGTGRAAGNRALRHPTAGRGAAVPFAGPVVSIAVPFLPGGGPSRRRRARDRAIDAAIRERMARVQRRVDSVVAARRQHAESLSRLADSIRDAGRPRC